MSMKRKEKKSYALFYFKCLLCFLFIGFNVTFHFQNIPHENPSIQIKSKVYHLYTSFRNPKQGSLSLSSVNKVEINEKLSSPLEEIKHKGSSNTLIHTMLDTGIESQYSEVEWVRGIQERRKLGLEPLPEDPYSNIPDSELFLPLISSLNNHILYHWKYSQNNKKKNTMMIQEMHFVHVPKAGGTSVTKVLRRMACEMHNGTEDTLDCCKNPGFCGAPEHRTCSVIKGCVNHFPKLKLNFNLQTRPSLTIIRQPLNRALSSWHYRCHNPNFDCYKIRLGLRTWKQHLNNEVLPLFIRNISFDEFIEMPEYHNIITRMFSRDIFPYGERKKLKNGMFGEYIGGNITIQDQRSAMTVLSQFSWVGVMEHMGTSLLLLSATLGLPLIREDFIRQRSSHSSLYTQFTKHLLYSQDKKSIERRKSIIHANRYDQYLWNRIRLKQCHDLKSLNIQNHQVVLRDLEASQLSPCPL